MASVTRGPLLVLLPLLGVLGLAVGSFLNVVIHRVPAGRSISYPPSRCASCGAAIRPYDNIPVLSWLVLRGRCRACSAPIGLRYPVVELGTGLLFVATGLRFGWSSYLPVALVLAAAGIALAAIDLEHRRLPFVITGWTAVLVVLGLILDAAVTGLGPAPVAALSALVWGVLYGGVWLVTSGRGMGLGDVALAPVLGLALGWLGWGASLVALLGGFVVGAVVGAGLMLAGRAARRSQLPHGPAMLVGAGIGLFAGAPIWSAYLTAMGLA